MKRVQAKDLCQLKSITQPVSDGQRTFFVETYIDAKVNRYFSRIASVDLNGNYQVWADGGSNVNPVINHGFLYYIHSNDQKFCLMKVALNGGLAKPVFDQGIISQLRTANNHLYFKVAQNVSTPKFNTVRFPKVRRVYYLVNRLDGYGWLPNHAIYNILSLNYKSGQIKKLFSSTLNFNFQSVDERSHQLIYLQAINHHRDEQISLAVGAFLYNFKSNRKRLINQSLPQGAFSNAQFFPDGEKVALIGNDNRYPGATVNDFYIYDVRSKALTDLTRDKDTVDDGLGLLSSDVIQKPSNLEIHALNDKTCVFHACHHGHSQLYEYQNGHITLIDNSKRFIFDFNAMDSHRIVLSSSSATSPCTLRLLNLSTHDEKLLYNPNQSYDKNHRYADAKAFSYRSDDGQVVLHGFCMQSIKDSPTASPIILYVHGGPHGAFGYSFMHRFQSLAANGYSIVFVNPRGSTGYGQSFEACVAGHYGEKDYHDILRGLFVAEHQFSGLDSKRVFIMGGSYGGFMTLWAIGHTNEFSGAIAQRPVSDWAMLYNTSDIGMSCRYDIGKDLYKDHALKLYWHKSPIAYARLVRTPLLLQHGEYDMRCPISQSEAYFTAVKPVDKDVTYYRYPQSFHGISRNGLPSLRIQRIKDVITWLNKHIN